MCDDGNKLRKLYDDLKQNMKSDLPGYRQAYALNFILVLCGYRPATIIEEPQKVLHDKVKDFSELVDIIKCNTELECTSGDLIYNKKLVPKNKAQKALTDNNILGEILGYVCPGELEHKGKVKMFSYNISATDQLTRDYFEFHNEYCANSPRDEIIKEKVKKFQEIGKLINMKINYYRNDEESYENILKMFREKNLMGLIHYKEFLINEYLQFDYQISANIINSGNISLIFDNIDKLLTIFATMVYDFTINVKKSREFELSVYGKDIEQKI